VLNADGTALVVDGGAPVEWIGTRIDEREDVGEAIKRAALETRRQLRSSAASSLHVQVHEGGMGTLRVLGAHTIPVRLVPTDLRALLKSSIRVMEQQARTNEVALTVEVAPDVPSICRLDPEKIAWAAAALVGNALRFVRRGTRLMPGGLISVQARFDSASSNIILEIRDDGSGIPADVLPRLLARQPDQTHAAGLALSLIRDVVAAHGGTLQIESSTEPRGSGTTVRLTLPAA
jgi:signal transduction histidine kinase